MRSYKNVAEKNGILIVLFMQADMILTCMFSVTEGKTASVRSHCDSLQTVNVFLLLLYVKTLCSTKNLRS